MARKPQKIDGQTYQYYVCGGHKSDAQKCSTHTIHAEMLEQAVLESLNFYIQSVKEMRQVLEAISRRPAQKLEVSS